MDPNPNPRNRWAFAANNSASFTEARMRELFWSVPETSALLEEAEQRIAAVLRKVFAPEPCNSSTTCLKTWPIECSSGRVLLREFERLAQ